MNTFKVLSTKSIDKNCCRSAAGDGGGFIKNR